ncbi:MAG: hypothetical protein ACI8ZB_003706 [Desulforhopalus sp.]|jgi:hypothetical protein
MLSPFDEASNCLVKKHLHQEKYARLQVLSTDSGFTLEKAIRSGVVNSDSAIGIYAGDAQSYEVFREVFDPVIQEYHGFLQGEVHRSDFTPVTFADPDPEKKYILSTRVRVARNVEGFTFTNNLRLRERQQLEKTVVVALAGLSEPFSGEYYDFGFETDKAILFKKGDRFQGAAGINADFPQCRGVFYAKDKRFRVWLNEEDHLRVISQDNSSDLAGVFNHLCSGLAAIENTLTFARDDRYGYLTSCPTNLGTSMRAGVHIRLENLNSSRDLLNAIIDKHQLQLRGTSGEHTDVKDSVFDISNKHRLGLSETEIINGLHGGILAIIATEKNCK